jgi:ABC-type branched-subunit amino acid transport system permease subunit
VVIVVVPELLRGVQDYRMLLFGAALVAMALRPEGSSGAVLPRRRPARRRERGRRIAEA